MNNLSKVYKGYVIEQEGNAWLIKNCPNWTNTNAISPGPHPSYTTATHQVDKLLEYLNRNNSNSAKYPEQDIQEKNEVIIAHEFEYEETSAIEEFIYAIMAIAILLGGSYLFIKYLFNL